MDKLTYIYKSNSTIEINLHNGYSVIVFEAHQQELHKFILSLYLKKDSINVLDLIESQDAVEISANFKTINNRVLKYVATLMEEGFFDYYMQRYDYMLRCFDKGNELFEAGAAND